MGARARIGGCGVVEAWDDALGWYVRIFAHGLMDKKTGTILMAGMDADAMRKLASLSGRGSVDALRNGESESRWFRDEIGRWSGQLP